MTGLADSFSAKHLKQRKAEDLEVKEDTPVIDIPDVEIKLLLPRNRVSAVDLCPSGDARHDLMAPSLFRRIARQLVHEKRTRPNEAQLATKHIE